MNKTDTPAKVASNDQLGQVPEHKDLAYPPGYCLDPNGRMCAPAEAGLHYDFGYEVGFSEAMAIKMRAIDVYVATERKRCAEVFNMARICAESHMRRGDDCGDLARRLLGALTGLRA